MYAIKVHLMRFNVGSTFEARVCKSEVTLDRVLNDLTAANGDKAQLATELDASQTEEGSCSVF
jgi:hypothetical protein